MSSYNPGFMAAAAALDPHNFDSMAAAEASKPLKVVIVGSGEVSRELVQGLMDRLDEKDRHRAQIEVVSAATATELYGYVPEPEPEPPDMKILAAMAEPILPITDEILGRERHDRAVSRVHRPHLEFGTFGRRNPLLNGSLAAAICSASLMAHYPTRRPPVLPDTEPEFLVDMEIEAREAGSMVHDQTEKAVMSAAEEKRARKAAKKAENEAKAKAGRGA